MLSPRYNEDATTNHESQRGSLHQNRQEKVWRKSDNVYRSVDEILVHYKIDLRKFLCKNESFENDDELILVLNSDQIKL